MADLGFSLLIAVLIRRGWERGTRSTRVVAGVFVGIHVVLAPLMGLAGDAIATLMGKASVAIARALPREVLPARRAFLFTASDPMVSLYVTAILLSDGGGGLDCMGRLTATAADHRVTRVDERTLTLEPIGQPMLLGPFELLYRSRALPSHVGDLASVCGARVRVAAVEGAFPTRLEVRFDVPLDDPSLALAAWDGERLARVRLEPGETRVLPWRRGPMGNQ